MANAPSSTEFDVPSIVAARAASYLVYANLGITTEQSQRLTSADALSRAIGVLRETSGGEALDRSAVVDAPIILDAEQTARFHEILGQGRRELTEPSVDLDAFNE
jgi:hypothetical protein